MKALCEAMTRASGSTVEISATANATAMVAGETFLAASYNLEHQDREPGTVNRELETVNREP